MLDRPNTITDASPEPDTRIAHVGTRPPAGLEAAAAGLGIAIVAGERLARDLPDALLLEAAAATDPALLAELAQPIHAEMAVGVLVGDGEADAAGALLDGRIDAFFPLDTPAETLLRWAAGRGRAAGHVADMGSRFDTGSRIETLRRDAERVAAALAELAAGRPPEPARPIDAGRIRAHVKARRLRERFLPADLFADPAWDMLLDLAAARMEARPVSVSSLCIAAAVPTTTGLRWIKALIDRGLLVRHSDPGDARRAFVSIAPAMADPVDRCIEAVLNFPGQ